MNITLLRPITVGTITPLWDIGITPPQDMSARKSIEMKRKRMRGTKKGLTLAAKTPPTNLNPNDLNHFLIET